MSITIATATTEDLEAILAIVNYEIAHTTAIYDEIARSMEQQKAIFFDKQKNNFPLLVAKENNKVIGFATYGTFRPKSAYRFTVEHSVYVKHNNHGKGIGKKLLLELMQQAKSQNIHTMIGVIDAENKNSILFHEKMGFKIVGRLDETGFKFGRWLHSIILQRML